MRFKKVVDNLTKQLGAMIDQKKKQSTTRV